jgi:hypothetical protein
MEDGLIQARKKAKFALLFHHENGWCDHTKLLLLKKKIVMLSVLM